MPENTGEPTGSPIFSDETKDAFKETIEKAAEQNLIKIPLGRLNLNMHFIQTDKGLKQPMIP